MRYKKYIFIKKKKKKKMWSFYSPLVKKKKKNVVLLFPFKKKKKKRIWVVSFGIKKKKTKNFFFFIIFCQYFVTYNQYLHDIFYLYFSGLDCFSTSLPLNDICFFLYSNMGSTYASFDTGISLCCTFNSLFGINLLGKFGLCFPFKV